MQALPRWRLLVAPTGSESVAIILSTWLLLRGLSTLAFNGISGPGMYAYALTLAPEWVWGTIPASIGAAWLASTLRRLRARRAMALAATWWFVAWAALLALGLPDCRVLAFVAPLLVMAAASAWSWLLLGWHTNGGA
jgi:hypothetical protein